MERTDDVLCAWTGCAEVQYANTYVDRQVGQPIVALRFFGPKPSTDDINTFRPLNLVIAIIIQRDFQPA